MYKEVDIYDIRDKLNNINLIDDILCFIFERRDVICNV